MKIAFNSYSGYGAHFALRLLAEGHSVDYYLSEDKFLPILQGFIKPKLINLDNRKKGINFSDGLPNYSKYDLSIFDLTGRTNQAEYSGSLTPTIGDGYFHGILEDERLAGIQFMEAGSITVPPYQRFDNPNEAKKFISETNKRYVYKPDGGQDQDAETTYVSKSAEDLLEVIDKIYSASKNSPFILQEFMEGTEVSVEGWFNGTEFYCINATLEEKKFMNGGVGPNTGCSGNLVFSLNRNSRLFKSGLGRIEKLLAEATSFRGMIDLNSIVTDSELYGLEWTPRFGYDASTTFMEMYGGSSIGQLLYDVGTGKVPDFSWKAEFGASVRLTIPPYPTELRQSKKIGIPIKGIDPKNQTQVLKTYLYDAKLDKDHLVTSGINGFIAAPVEIGSSIPEAFGKLDETVKRIQIPDMQYRTDIQKTVSERYYDLLYKGWL